MLTQGYADSVIDILRYSLGLKVQPVVLVCNCIKECIVIVIQVRRVRNHASSATQRKERELCACNVAYHFQFLSILLYKVHAKAYVMVTCHKLPTRGEGN